MPENSLSKVLAAAATTAGWHATQRRKGSAGEPYINHLLEVAALVSRVTRGEDADLVVAALIHDAVEDQGISGQTIAAMGRMSLGWCVGSDRQEVAATGSAQAPPGR